MKSKILSLISQSWQKNRKTEYSQTWNYMPKDNRLKKVIQFICNIFGGHELSNTEWGYGGGEYADRWCRWCNKMIQVPKESIYFRFKDTNPRELMGQVGKEKQK